MALGDASILADEGEKPYLFVDITAAQWEELSMVFPTMTADGRKLGWHMGLAIREGRSNDVVDAIRSTFSEFGGIDTPASRRRSMLKLADKIESASSDLERAKL